MNEIEAFQKAYAEIQTTTDPYRFAFLHWVGFHLHKNFDYVTGLQAINDGARKCKPYTGARTCDLNFARGRIWERQASGKLITNQLKPDLFPD